LTASEDATARVWGLDQKTIEQAACLTGHSAEVMRASCSQDGTMIATGVVSVIVCVVVAVVQIGSDCSNTAPSAGSADQTARIWKLQDNYGSECVSILGGHSEELYCAEWVHNRDNLLLTASGSTVAIWDTVTGEKVSELGLVSPSVSGAHPAYVHTTGACQHPGHCDLLNLSFASKSSAQP
jgi:WD40 repeat protein